MLSFSQVISLLVIGFNVISLFFVSYGVVYRVWTGGYTYGDLEGKSTDSSLMRHIKKTRLYTFIGIIFIVVGSILQSIGIVYSG